MRSECRVETCRKRGEKKEEVGRRDPREVLRERIWKTRGDRSLIETGSGLGRDHCVRTTRTESDTEEYRPRGGHKGRMYVSCSKGDLLLTWSLVPRDGTSGFKPRKQKRKGEDKGVTRGDPVKVRVYTTRRSFGRDGFSVSLTPS